MYVTGYTHSADFPTTAGAYDGTYNGLRDAFVVKLNVTGSGLDYATYLGGENADSCGAIVLDSLGDAYVAGSTQSSEFQ